MSRVEHIGDATLYLADCREILPTLGKVDAVVTDPPYGVEFAGKRAHSSERQLTTKRDDLYASYHDTAENFAEIVAPAVELAIAISRSAAVFTADVSLWHLPPAAALGGIYLPAGTGSGPWGFKSFMFCAFYGADPYLATGRGRRPSGKHGLWANDANEIAHPCAKPLDAMRWAVARASLEAQTVLDPFMGSGTTGVAALKLGRKFIGIEIEPKYFDIACRRIEEAWKQPRLFDEPQKKPEQLTLLAAGE